MTAEVVTLGRPSLQDIPGMLRQLADRIEAGEFGEVDGLIAVMPRDLDYPQTFGWGNIEGAFDPIIQLELAREWHVKTAAGFGAERV